ncbi:MAG: class I SAM-dependent methyltransferase [Limisphaerales bacterium]
MASDVESILRSEIRERGPVTFARFMELALYAPGAGYYEREGGQTGRRGDYYTSVSVGPVLGFLLAAWVAEGCATFASIDCVEAAAHDGQLAVDVLTALGRFHPATAERVRYRILEPSAVRRGVQARTLEAAIPDLFRSGRVGWVSGWEEFLEPPRGVVFSNELLDAMPVHRLAWDATERRWFEWGVALEGDRFVECRMEPTIPEVRTEMAPLEAVLPDGFVVERSPAAVVWWTQAARALGRGAIAALDYGFGEDDVVRPERVGGTARAYRGHRRVDDLLARPGAQDLTAHVDFPRLLAAGESEGLTTTAFLPQGRWLGRLAARVMSRGGAGAAWLAERARGLQTLTHPGHLGHVMRVLAQERR